MRDFTVTGIVRRIALLEALRGAAGFALGSLADTRVHGRGVA